MFDGWGVQTGIVMNFLSAIVLIALLVFIHEFGHFIVAKMCGVRCSVLSIGYGNRVVGFVWRGTDYRISALPFGGYVRMAGADPFGDGHEDDGWLEDQNEAFMRKPVWKRLLIVAAGPAFNLMLPIVTITALLMAGEPQPDSVVGSVEWNSPAQEAGLKPGDRIVSIDDQSIGSWQQFVSKVGELSIGEHTVEVVRIEQDKEVVSKRSFELSEERGLGVDFLIPSAEVGIDDPESPAGKAGLITGDVVLSVNSKEVGHFFDLQRLLDVYREQSEDSVDILYVRNGEEQTAHLFFEEYKPKAPLRMVGVDSRYGLLPATIFVSSVKSAVIEPPSSGCQPAVMPTSSDRPMTPAEAQGIREGDRFVSVDGVEIHAWMDVLKGVKQSVDEDGAEAAARTITVRLMRDGVIQELDITPKVIQDTDAFGRYRYRPVLGASRSGDYEMGPNTRIYYQFDSALEKAVSQTWRISKFIVEQLGKLITGEAAVEKSLGGPVEMVRQASKAAEAGLFEWVRLMSMLSISLGIINLVPVPVLDGGQILFYLAEAVRGRPLSPRIREAAQQIGVLFLVLLMLTVLFFDINRLLGG
ncbi:MAG: hypothetical protein CMK59_13070 [Proteobacteria bacterium]|nr:hypothetical protein [Pseudomonadota bacterium]